MALAELDLDSCRLLSAKHGLPLDFVVKEFRVFDALAELVGFEGGTELVFKGGTALNKIYFGEGAQRFSEDLDFDLAAVRDLASARKFVERVSVFMQAVGFTPRGIRRLGRREPSLQVELEFDSPLGRKDFVRFDFAVKPAIAWEDVVKGVTARSSFTARAVGGLQAYSLDGLVARKISALADRCEGKDVFDVVRGIGKTSQDFPAAVRRMLSADGRSQAVKEFLLAAARRLRGADFVELRNLVNPYIPLALRPRDAAAWKTDALTLAAELERRAGV
ncbi:MAG: nucleotidyl transferase AbiEii/AbiGii toxin family protein [Candidatus Micrarchaeota archaeon]